MQTLAVTALGVRTRLQVADHLLADDLARLLAPLTEPGADPGPDPSVTVGGSGPFTVESAAGTTVVDGREEALGLALAALNLRTTSQTPLLACHGAFLATDGAGLLVPAASGSGKSTLTASLLRLGWDYGSDESLGLTWDEGRTVPYPRPFALSTWSREATGTEGGTPGTEETYHLAPSAVPPGVPVAHVVLLARGPEPDLQPVHRATALVELFRRSFTHHRDPARALVLYADLLRSASCWQLTLGHPTASAELLTRRLGP